MAARPLKRSRLRSWAALLLGATLGCGGASGPGPDAGPAPGPGRLWRLNAVTRWIEGYDFGERPVLSTAPVDDARMLAADAGRIWALTSPSGVAAFSTVDAAELARRSDVGHALHRLAARAGQVWVADEGRPNVQRQRLLRLDPRTAATLAMVEVGDASEKVEALAPTPEALYVLLGPHLALVRVDVRTHAPTGRVELGEDPARPGGPRGRFPGFGELVVLGSTAWVLDRSSHKLLEITLPALAIRTVLDARPALGGQNDLEMKGAGRTLVVHARKASTLFAFDVPPRPGAALSAARRFQPGSTAGTLEARIDHWDIAGDRLAASVGLGAVLLLGTADFGPRAELRTVGAGPLALE
jgi:hypothetical protein